MSMNFFTKSMLVPIKSSDCLILCNIGFNLFKVTKPDFLIDPLKFGKFQQSDAYKLEVTIFEMCSIMGANLIYIK